jgi:dihydrofolate reductase
MKRKQSSNIILLAAVAANGVIGAQNKMLWHIPRDMARFVKQTTGHAVVMGRKTHESIGKVLPGRVNYVLTHDRNYQTPFEGNVIVVSKQEVLELAQAEKVFIIGGEQVYREFIDHAAEMRITNINKPFAGDAYFPETGLNWQHVGSENFQPDEQVPFSYSFDTYVNVALVKFCTTTNREIYATGTNR